LVFQTEYKFTLPKGYMDSDGNLYKKGTMRLATAADEIVPLRDPRVQQNAAYLNIILFSRVITELEGLPMIDTKVIEGLFASDLAYLQNLYVQINGDGTNIIKAKCPKCEHEFDVEVILSGE